MIRLAHAFRPNEVKSRTQSDAPQRLFCRRRTKQMRQEMRAELIREALEQTIRE